MNKKIVQDKATQRMRNIKKIKKKRRLVTLSLFLLIVIGIVGLVFLCNSDFFNIKKIIVVGNKHVSEDKIIKQSSIGTNTSLFGLPSNEIRTRILKEAWIEDVEVVRHFPNSVELKVVEREAIAIVPFQDIYLIVDKNLVVLESRESIDDLALPVILDLKLTKAKIGEKINLPSLENAVNCLVSFDKDFRKTIIMANAPSIEKLTLMISVKNGDGELHDVEVLYGEADDEDVALRKNAIIKKILTESKKHVIYIDVRVVTNPAVKFLDDVY
ncbi:FtsQ-type POTRA domain-containing protein [Candidatus Oleimmundimicrobium sp.]|uniref:cell division protein FtsQ/DivIB n=1 Tax=Candidatus Oleimmundimicrobium sp. TaxID=3060597 RepID=UPI00271C4390|nr:FtsQ-type POTRA domain-containing protein [Candidatus Oleimmundimicrobium sp.]MDO8885512.1 FtsQ-type POTRA domain-containing protein [Candidatus Oleimmundimicrobium sp.]